MARARNIKPGFFTNDVLAECEPLARILFAGLWTIADRAGRLEDRPKKIKAEILPYDNCDVDKLLNELRDRAFILRYEVGGVRYIQILAFEKHQNPHVKEAESLIPAPGESGANPVQDTTQTGTSHADSLNLIPDSLNPLTTKSGKPDDSPSSKFVNGVRAQAVEVLEFLNAKAQKAYRPVDVNLELIVARLKEGATVQDMKSVIAKKVREWSADDKMKPYLRPATLFNRTKFAQYVGELVTNEQHMPSM